jgi:hypothetical protein
MDSNGETFEDDDEGPHCESSEFGESSDAKTPKNNKITENIANRRNGKKVYFDRENSIDTEKQKDPENIVEKSPKGRFGRVYSIF